MKVATKLALAFGLHTLLLVGLLVHHVSTIREAVSTGHELSEISSRLQVSSIEQLDRIAQLEENASKYLVTRERGYLAKFDEVFLAFDDALHRLDSPSLSDEERLAIERLAAAWPSFAPLAEALPTVARTGAPRASQDYLAALHATLDELRFHAQGVSEAAQTVMAVRLERTANAARQAERLSWIAAAAALLLSILVSGFIVRSIAERLSRLKVGTREVAEGNFDYRLDDSPGDEFAEVARDFNTMTLRLDELDRMKQSFVSKVSHDLKTPLSSMQEVTGVLLDELPGPLTPKQRELLELNLQSGRRLAAMIGKLLDLSRMEAGALRPEMRTHELNPLVRRAIASVRPLAGEHGPRIETALPETAVLIECDADRVLQLMENLLENALKFSPGDATLHVAARYCAGPDAEVPPERWRAAPAPDSAAGAVLLSVADRGPGVPDEEKARIFERFYQSEAGRRVRSRGVGLGLTICREIVDAHGGSIWVQDRPGGGSTFSVLLPRALRVPDAALLAGTADARGRVPAGASGAAPVAAHATEPPAPRNPTRPDDGTRPGDTP